MILLDIDYGVLFDESLKIGVPVLLAVFGGLGTLLTFLGFKSSTAKKEDASKSFNNIVDELASAEIKTNIAAAIKIRRFFAADVKKHSAHLCKEAINVISSLLRVLSTGVLQKTLADGLAYAENLSLVDLQRTNLQNAYIGYKKERKQGQDLVGINEQTHKKITIYKTDFFLADLSYALFEFVEGNAYFTSAILCHTRFKVCDLRGANFRGADLSNVFFKQVQLKGADFSEVINLPESIKEKLDKDSKYTDDEPYTTPEVVPEPKQIFFSIPSVLDPQESFYKESLRVYLKERGYHVIPYVRDLYPQFGQIKCVAERVKMASGMVVFGFKQTHIIEGYYRPGTEETKHWTDKWLPSPWNEIEVGMAAMKDIPVLILKEKGINTGIFDSVLSETDITTYTVPEKAMSIEWEGCNELQQFLSKL